MGDASDQDRGQRLITSHKLSRGAVAACWTVSLLLLASGIASTFLDKAGAAAATMLAMGGILAILALMKRIPLRLEVAGTKLDAAYPPPDEAFAAGRERGLQEGLERAVRELDRGTDSGESVEELNRELQQLFTTTFAARPLDAIGPSAPPGGDPDDRVMSGTLGYRGPTAARVAGTTYRQLDYWARTGLVSPSLDHPDRRLYSVRDIVILTVVKRLLDTGVSLVQIRTVVELLKDRSLPDFASITLISDGESVHEVTSPDQMSDLLTDGRALFGIGLGGVVQDVQQALRHLPGTAGH